MRPVDLHRPAIDDLTRPNPDDPTGRSTMRRVTEVLDCWFDSGSMPFAQVHYPFENREWFEEHFPGDFIVEYIGQTRGWFYSLHVLAVALFDRPAFKLCLTHGILLGDDGQKMSKRLRNYPDPEAMFDTYGADAMRWFLMASPVLRGGEMIADEKGIKDAVRSSLLPLWNAWYFFSLYANADGPDGHPGTHRRDRDARPLRHRQTQLAGRDRHRRPGPLRPVGRVLRHRELPRRPDQLVHQAQPGPVLGDRRRPRGGHGRRLRHPGNGARSAVPPLRPAAAPADRGDLARA